MTMTSWPLLYLLSTGMIGMDKYTQQGFFSNNKIGTIPHITHKHYPNEFMVLK